MRAQVNVTHLSLAPGFLPWVNSTLAFSKKRLLRIPFSVSGLLEAAQTQCTLA